MEIRTANFLMSNTEVSKCPPADRPEYAFIGRSNVGKSSLINMLVNNKKLAKTSQQPGKTQHINHYLINESWYLVDLPGYGYAKISKAARQRLQTFIIDYVLKRINLYCLLVLIDSRHEPQKIDLEFMSWLGENEVPFALIFTKADKLGKHKLAQNVESYKKELEKQWETLPPIMISSSETKLGRDEILDFIERTIVAGSES